MKEVYEFLKKAGIYYLATIENNEPRVRPFGTINMFEDKLYIQTGRSKKVSNQIKENPKVEICAMYNGDWIRITTTLVDDNRVEAKKAMLDNYPELQSMYNPEDENTQVLYCKDTTATIYSFTKEPITIKF